MSRSQVAGSFTACAALAGGLAAVINHRAQSTASLHQCQSAVSLDGDTIKCVDGVRLRLNGIDARELPGHRDHGTVFPSTINDGYLSWRILSYQVDSNTLTYQPLKTDRYGRTVAEVWIGGHDVSCEQLRRNSAVYVPKWDEQRTLARTCSWTAMQ